MNVKNQQLSYLNKCSSLHNEVGCFLQNETARRTKIAPNGIGAKVAPMRWPKKRKMTKMEHLFDFVLPFIVNYVYVYDRRPMEFH